MSAIPKRVRDTVLTRADGACEGCGTPTNSLELHHRKYRSRGGKHTVDNLLALCGWGNHTGCHGRAHTDPEAVIDGWSVNSWDDPAHRPVLWRGRFVFLLTVEPWVEDMGEVTF